jgi:membrane protease YdiL (CAAX protease family)
MTSIEETSIKLTDNTRLYILTVMVISYIWQIIIYFNGGVDSFLVPLMMFIPGIIAWFFMRKSYEGFKNIGWGLGNRVYLIAAVFVPLVCTVGLILLFQGLGWATLTVFTMENGLITSKVSLLLGNQPQGIWFFTLNLAASFTQISLIGSLFAFGEEFGWRGYLQGKMTQGYGVTRGLILLGVLWGYWHLPLILMGFTFPNMPVLGGFVLFPISTVFMAIYHGWIYLRSKSIWAPVLSHGAFNIAGGMLFGGMIFQGDMLVFQMFWMAMLGLLAIPCYISLKKSGFSME